MQQPESRLNNSALTQIVHAAWLAETRKKALPDREEMSKLLFEGDVPWSIRAIHKTADQLTALIFEGQEIDIIERANPSHRTAQLKYDLVQALNLLDELALEFPTEVDWARNRIRSFASQRL